MTPRAIVGPKTLEAFALCRGFGSFTERPCVVCGGLGVSFMPGFTRWALELSGYDVNQELEQGARRRAARTPRVRCVACGGSRVLRYYQRQPVGIASCGSPGPLVSAANVREAPGGAGAEGTSGAQTPKHLLELAERLVDAVVKRYGFPKSRKVAAVAAVLRSVDAEWSLPPDCEELADCRVAMAPEALCERCPYKRGRP